MNGRGPEEGKNIDIVQLVQQVFTFIYESSTSDKLFSKPKTYQENSILNNLVNQSPFLLNQKRKNVVMKFFMNIYLLLKINVMKNFYHF